jgi:hypothetical protein
MADDVLRAESSPLTDEDTRKRDLVKELMQAQSKVILDFAKQLVTISFAAVGVVISLKDRWIGADAPSYQEALLGVAVALFLVSALVATLAASARGLRVSLSDYADVDVEVHRVATLRHRLTLLGFGLAAVATTVVASVALIA